MFNIVQELKDYLILDNPVEIVIKSKEKKNADANYWGMYNRKGILKSHLIHIYAGNQSERSLNSLIAHELIHAWQEEQGLKEIHGPEFIKLARNIEYDYDLENVYLVDIDK
jgi:Zn-dependent peptidase ImmA (M78 family)